MKFLRIRHQGAKDAKKFKSRMPVIGKKPTGTNRKTVRVYEPPNFFGTEPAPDPNPQKCF